MDPIAQVVELLRPHALHRCRHMHGRGDWAVRFPEDSKVVFGLIAAGSCHLDFPGFEARRLRAGDFVLMNAPPSWVLRNGADVAPIDFEPMKDEASTSVFSFGHSQGDDLTRIIGGHFAFDTANADLLTEVVPSIIIVESSLDTGWRIGSLLKLIDDEVSFDRPGQLLVIDKLLQVILLETLRAQAGQADLARNGLLAGLADRRIALALQALHADVKRKWTVQTLAEQAGMSRSAFAAQFRERVGVAPVEYLLNWRLGLAKDALRYSNRPLADVALSCGYASTSAFSTAFTRTVGSPPGLYSTQQR